MHKSSDESFSKVHIRFVCSILSRMSFSIHILRHIYFLFISSLSIRVKSENPTIYQILLSD